MPRLGAVVEAVCAFAGFAAEWEEVELVAVGVLAVGAYGVEVFVHGCEGLGFGTRWWGGGCGSHSGRFVGISLWIEGAAVSGSLSFVSWWPCDGRWGVW